MLALQPPLQRQKASKYKNIDARYRGIVVSYHCLRGYDPISNSQVDIFSRQPKP